MVTSFGGSSGSAVQVATVVVAPTVTQTTANLAQNAATLTIDGSGFDSTTPSANAVVLSSGAGTVTAATSTSLTVTLSSSPPRVLGALTAVVTSFGGTSGGPVTVGTIVAPSYPYLAFSDVGNSNKVTVQMFDGTSWVFVGSPGFSSVQAAYVSLALSFAGVPYVVYRDGGNSNKVTVQMFDGTSWVYVGSPGFSPGQVSDVSLAVSSAGVPFVAYIGFTDVTVMTVQKFDGTVWAVVGSPISYVNWYGEVSLALSSAGVPYVAYSDYNPNVGLQWWDNQPFSAFGKLSVKKFDGTSWAYVGSPAISSNFVDYSVALEKGRISMALSPMGVPYVAYQDVVNHGPNPGSVSVQKFDETSWVYVGSPGITGFYVDYVSLTLSSTGVPYVGYTGIGGYGYPGYQSVQGPAVMKFEGTWSYVGSPQFSGGFPTYNSLTLS